MEEKLDFKQMKLFIRILRMTYCFYQVTYSTLYVFIDLSPVKAFNYIDSEGTHVISKEEFTSDATKEVLEFWLGPNEDWEETFDNIDLTNKKGEGNVLFRVRREMAADSLLMTCCRSSLTGPSTRTSTTWGTWGSTWSRSI